MSSPKIQKKSGNNSPKLEPNRSNQDLIEELEIENTADDQVIQKMKSEESDDLSRGSEKGQIVLPDLDEAMNIEENSNTHTMEEKKLPLTEQRKQEEEKPLF